MSSSNSQPDKKHRKAQFNKKKALLLIVAVVFLLVLLGFGIKQLYLYSQQKTTDTTFSEGKKALRAGDYDKAITLFKEVEATSFEKDNYHFYAEIGQAYFLSGDDFKATQYANDGIKKLPKPDKRKGFDDVVLYDLKYGTYQIPPSIKDTRQKDTQEGTPSKSIFNEGPL